MKVKKVEIVPIKPQEGLLAFASVEIDDIFITSIGVHKRRDGSGFRLTYPSRKAGQHQVTICHPTTPNLSKEIELAVCAQAEKVLGL